MLHIHHIIMSIFLSLYIVYHCIISLNEWDDIIQNIARNALFIMTKNVYFTLLTGPGIKDHKIIGHYT